jgi:hypothetical protein
MSSEHAPAGAPPRWGLRQSAAAVAVAAVVAGVGGGAIYAATAAGASQLSGSGPHQPFGGFGFGGPGSGFGGAGFGGAGFGGAGFGGPDDGPLHSESVAAVPGGGYTTRLTQKGTVTAVSAGSVTIRSDDGYTVTYVLPSEVAAPAGGESVSVEGSRDGAVTTLGRIAPRTR